MIIYKLFCQQRRSLHVTCSKHTFGSGSSVYTHSFLILDNVLLYNMQNQDFNFSMQKLTL